MNVPGSDELFDIVNERDEVVGQAPRGEVHARHLLHRAVHVMIHNAEGRFFSQKRSLSKDMFPGCWDSSCTGHVDAGETCLVAARRELGEELGWHDATLELRPLVKLTASPATGYEFIQIYLAGPISGPFELHPEEITDGRWISPTELDALVEKTPEQVAGALRFLWQHHRLEILGAVEKTRFAKPGRAGQPSA